MGRATVGASSASIRQRSAASREAKRGARPGYASVLLAVLLALLWSAPIGNSLAASLDAAAYNITTGPKPGPVQEFRPIKALPPVPFELPFDWGMDPYHDRTWRFRLHTLRNLVDKRSSRATPIMREMCSSTGHDGMTIVG